VSSFQWTPDSRTIFFNAQDEVNVRIYRVALRDGAVRPVTGGAYDGAFAWWATGASWWWRASRPIGPRSWWWWTTGAGSGVA
jgi:hypothetical protein